MKDLDFDELDRAVNSVISGRAMQAPKPREVSEPVPVESTPEDSRRSESSAVPVTVRTIPPVETVAPPSPAVSVAPDELSANTQPLAARRSSGRFMDVVHPSSDMRTAVTTPVSRKGVDVSPVSTDTTPRTEEPVPVEPLEPFSWSEESRSLADAENSADTSSDWPDPLDMPDFSYSPPEGESPAPTPVTVPELTLPSLTDDDDDINQIANTIPVLDTTPAPQESPFLTDAKIQKRPLGAFTVEANSITGETEADATVEPDTEVLSRFSEPTRFTTTETSQNQDAQLPVTVDEEALPAELQDEVLLLEANLDNTAVTAKDSMRDAKEAFAQSFTGPTSISQQYDEQPNTGDQQTGAIYDTEAYHKPLAHPVKKKSGWMMIIWILLLLVVGAGAGAAVYFFVLPLL